MGREIKRVAANFTWPIDKVWEGFINPHNTSIKCLPCDGSGESPEAKDYKNQWYGYVRFDPKTNGSVLFAKDHKVIASLAKRNCQGGWSTEPVERRRLADHFNGQRSHHLSQEEVDILRKEGRVPAELKTAQQVNEWSLQGFGHDCINLWILQKWWCKNLGKPTECMHCKGDGHTWPSKEAEKLYNDWKEEKPPAGDWWQLWSTTSEGSPMTPAFATAEELARYCADYKVSTFGSDTADYATWLRFITGDGWAPSAIMTNGQIQSGVAAVAAGYLSII